MFQSFKAPNGFPSTAKIVNGLEEPPSVATLPEISTQLKFPEETLLSEQKVNNYARSLVALGLIAGEQVATWKIHLPDQLALTFAADMLGLQLIDLSAMNSSVNLNALLHVHHFRVLFINPEKNSRQSLDFLTSVKWSPSGFSYVIGDFKAPFHCDQTLSWEEFAKLSRYITDAELQQQQVV